MMSMKILFATKRNISKVCDAVFTLCLSFSLMKRLKKGLQSWIENTSNIKTLLNSQLLHNL